ncbi:hypothetical protein EVA_10965 [gut metagenome]|uniref:Uncharacterized protein n=1 Tax=gut metagenome TaxID=749906 RepID=J9GM80_9ZZZZ
MNCFIHFACEDLFCASNGKSSNFIAKGFASTLHFLSGFSLCIGNDAISFDLSLSLSFINNVLGTLFAISNDIGSGGTGISFNGFALFRSDCQSFLALIGSSKTIGNLLLPLFNRID